MRKLKIWLRNVSYPCISWVRHVNICTCDMYIPLKWHKRMMSRKRTLHSKYILTYISKLSLCLHFWFGIKLFFFDYHRTDGENGSFHGRCSLIILDPVLLCDNPFKHVRRQNDQTTKMKKTKWPQLVYVLMSFLNDFHILRTGIHQHVYFLVKKVSHFVLLYWGDWWLLNFT